MREMTEDQKSALAEVLNAFANALHLGIAPDLLIDRIIERAIDIERGWERDPLEGRVGHVGHI